MELHRMLQKKFSLDPIALTAAATTMAVMFPDNNLLSDLEDTSDPDMADLINPHWKTFPKPLAALNITFGILCFLLGLVGIAGNATVIFIFSKSAEALKVEVAYSLISVADFLVNHKILTIAWPIITFHLGFHLPKETSMPYTKTRRLRNPSNSLIVNLAVSDFCMIVSLCPMYFLSSMREQWIFGRNACRFYGFCGTLFGTASIITMTGIAIDKYLAICKPFTTVSGARKGSRARMIILFVWMYSVGWATPPLFGINNYVLEGFLTTCSFDFLDKSTTSRIFILAMCIGAYFLPLLLIATAYTSIIWKVHTTSKRFNMSLSPTSHKDSGLSSKMRREISTAKATFIVVVCWTVAWTPYAVVALLGIASYTSALTPLVAQLPAVFAKTAAVYNPFVYALSHPRYREALRGWLLSLIYKRGHQSDTGDDILQSRPVHISFNTRSGQKRSNLSIKYSAAYGTLKTISQFQRRTKQSNEAVPSKLRLPNSNDVFKNKSGRDCVPRLTKHSPKTAEEDHDYGN